MLAPTVTVRMPTLSHCRLAIVVKRSDSLTVSNWPTAQISR